LQTAFGHISLKKDIHVMKAAVKFYLLCTVIGLFCGEIVQVTSDENNVREYKIIPSVFKPHTDRGQEQTTRKWVPQCEFVPAEFDLSIFDY